MRVSAAWIVLLANGATATTPTTAPTVAPTGTPLGCSGQTTYENCTLAACNWRGGVCTDCESNSHAEDCEYVDVTNTSASMTACRWTVTYNTWETNALCAPMLAPWCMFRTTNATCDRQYCTYNNNNKCLPCDYYSRTTAAECVGNGCQYNSSSMQCTGITGTLAAARVAYAPTTSGPTTHVPTSLAPVTAAPVTLAPTGTLSPAGGTHAPASAAPTTVAPTSLAPTDRLTRSYAPTTIPPTGATTTAWPTSAPTAEPSKAPTTVSSGARTDDETGVGSAGTISAIVLAGVVAVALVVMFTVKMMKSKKKQPYTAMTTTTPLT